MPEEILKLGLDATDLDTGARKAESILVSLNAKLAQVRTVLNGVASSSDKVNKSLNQTANINVNINTANAQQALLALVALSAQVRSNLQGLRVNGSSGPGAGSNSSYNFERSILGVAAGNIVSSAALGALKEFKTGISDAIDWERRLAQVSALTGKGVDNLADSILRASNRFNLSKNDITEATLKASQTGQSGALPQAFVLSKTTGASAVESIEALSIVMNAFGRDSVTADHAASILFNTVKTGNVTVGELATNFSKVSSVAAPLGLSADETAAALATLTHQGINASDAATLLSQVLLRLALPTEDIKLALKNLGVTSVEQAIKLYGFSETLKAVQHQAGDTAEAIGKAFSPVRTSRGGIVVADQAFKDYGKNLEEQRGKVVDFNKELEKVQDIAGEQVAKALNTAENAFTHFGKSIVDFTGGGKKNWLGDFFEIGVEGIDLAAQHLEYLGRQSDRLNSPDKLTRLQAQRDKVIAEGATGYDSLGLPNPKGSVENQIKDLDEQIAQQRLVDDFIKQATEKKQAAQKAYTDAIIKNNDTQLNAARDFFVNAQKAHRDYLETQTELEKDQTKEFKTEVDVRVKDLEESLSRQRAVVTHARDLIKDSQGRVQGLQESADHNAFSRQLQLFSPEQQAKLLYASTPGQANNALNFQENILGRVGNPFTQRVSALKEHADKQMFEVFNKTGEDFINDKSIQNAIKSFAELEDIQKQQYTAVADAFKSGQASQQDVLAINTQINDTVNHRIELEQKLQDQLKAREEQEKEAARKQEANIENLKNKIKEFFELKQKPGESTEEFNKRAGLAKGGFESAIKTLTPEAQANLTIKGIEKQAELIQTQEARAKSEKQLTLLNDQAATMFKAAQGSTNASQVQMTQSLLFGAAAANNNPAGLMNPAEANIVAREQREQLERKKNSLTNLPKGNDFNTPEARKLVEVQQAANEKAEYDRIDQNKFYSSPFPGGLSIPFPSFIPKIDQFNHTFISKPNGNSTTVGDINVSVTGRETPRETADEIGKALRRGIRRRTIDLSGE